MQSAGPAVADASSRRPASGAKPPALPKAGSGKGGYYQDDGPGDIIPEGLMDTPDAEPKIEPYSPRANRPYVVFGKTYTPIADGRPFKQRGVASWYGKKFHGQKTSSGEPYDMYKMTAAHPTLPIPSYVRVSSLATGNQVIVRVNDRGPFHSNRIIDLSYTAALKLGYLGRGSGEVEVELLLPDEIARINATRQARSEPQPARAMNNPAAEPVRANETAPVSPMPASVVQVSLSGAAPAMPTGLPNAPASGFYLQLGAYSQAANAEAVRARIAQNWDAAVPAPEVAQTGAVYRLYSGPFPSRAEAEAAARQLTSALGSARLVIVQR